jgi:putative chitinase
MLTSEMMRRRWPHGDQHVPGLIDGIVASAPAAFEKYQIIKCANPALVIAHMMAQFSEECGCGLEMIENMNYSAQRLLEVFPRHFTPSMALRWAHHPQVIGEIAYGGRMGNAPPPSTEGYDRRGAGLSQVTARDGQSKLNDFLKMHGATFDIMESPELIIDPAHTLECGVADWLICGCLAHAERDDIVGETRALNGGLNGLAERRRELALWKRELAI